MDLETPSSAATRAWAATEFAALDCRDVRRKRRFERVASDFLSQPGVSIPHACGDWAGTKACYRLFDHAEMTEDRILDAHRGATCGRLAGDGEEGFLLVIQDTSALNFSTRSAMEGLGPIGSQKVNRTPGLFLHGHLVVGESGTVHGMLGADIYARRGRDDDPKGMRNRQPLHEKESQRWADGWLKSQELWQDLGGNRRVLSVADREADIYELLLMCQQERAEHGDGAGFLIRSNHSRPLDREEGGVLWQAPEDLTVLAGLEVEIPRGKQGLKSRRATLTVRAGQVRVAAPTNKRKYLGLKESVGMWVLEVVELEPPPGVTPICWRLLTTEPVMTARDAERLVSCYALRWRIEMLFRILKSGCRVEDRQVKSVKKLKAFIALDLVVACHLLALTMQARSKPDDPADRWLAREEWEALCVHAAGGGPAPARCPGIGDAVMMIARLGGFLARKSDGEPGSEVLWRGFAKLKIYAEAWKIFTHGFCG
jgi:hypothetical protein